MSKEGVGIDFNVKIREEMHMLKKVKFWENKFFYPVTCSILVLVALCIAWFMLYERTSLIIHLPDPVDGISDGMDVNYEEGIARLSREMEFYPWQLYTSEDFSKGDVIAPKMRDEVPNAHEARYATFRTVVQLPPNTYFSLAGYSVDYGTRMYANGVEVANVGVVSSDPDIAQPGVNYMHFGIYSGEDGVVEFIIQFSNFVHPESGFTPFLYISTPENINRMIVDIGLPTYILSGGLILLAAYYFLHGVLRKNKIAMLLSFCCLLFSLRDQWFYIVSLIPYDYNWYIHYRVVVLVGMLTPVAILTLINASYPKVVPRIITYIYIGINLIATVMLFVLSTMYSARFSTVIQILAVPYTLLLIVGIIRYYIKARNFTLKDAYLTIGIIILILTATVDLWYSDNLIPITRSGITPIGMLLFVIIFMSILAQQAALDEVELEKSNRDKLMLEQIALMKSEFFAKLAHEIKVPLSVMSGYAQLTNMQIEHEEIGKDTVTNLKVITTEAKRLADLVSNLLEMPVDMRAKPELSKVSLIEYLEYCTVLCKAVLDGHDNEFVVNCEEDVYIMANTEMLIQLMLNLAFNSNKFMKNGKFSVEVILRDNDTVSLIISDTGSGIEEKNRENIFEKGFSTGGSKGLGLAICKEIAEFHEGEIALLDSKGGAKFEISGLKIIKEE